jgi:hypothetical protein
MGSSCRHFKALMRKNWINWKRTLRSSICELLCPVALMVILGLARLAVEKPVHSESSQISLSSLYYPVPDFNLSAVNKTSDAFKFYNQESYSLFYNFSNLTLDYYNPAINLVLSSCESTEFSPERPLIGFSPNNSIT